VWKEPNQLLRQLLTILTKGGQRSWDVGWGLGHPKRPCDGHTPCGGLVSIHITTMVKHLPVTIEAQGSRRPVIIP